MNGRSQRGNATVETSLLLPMLCMLMLLVVEGGNALMVYMRIVDASREGARLILREGEGSVDMNAFIRSIVNGLDAQYVRTKVVDGDSTVTVEVDYEYQTLWGGTSIWGSLGMDVPVFKASTTMPLQ